jgi:hypothetical protein
MMLGLIIILRFLLMLLTAVATIHAGCVDDDFHYDTGMNFQKRRHLLVRTHQPHFLLVSSFTSSIPSAQASTNLVLLESIVIDPHMTLMNLYQPTNFPIYVPATLAQMACRMVRPCPVIPPHVNRLGLGKICQSGG